MENVLRKEYSGFINIWLISLLSSIGIIVIVVGLTRLTDSGLSITSRLSWMVYGKKRTSRKHNSKPL